MNALKKHGRHMVAAVLVTVGVAGSAVALQRRQAEPLTLIQATTMPTAMPTRTATPAPVVVFVSGEVVAPGVYTLPHGSRVVDALAAAGGLSVDAEPSGINQAVLLQDGMQIHVPTVGEGPPPPALPQSAPGGAAQSGAKLNINRASAAELETLPGIGPSLAEAIVQHREINGAFASIEQLMDVPGIGAGKFDDIRELVTIE